MRSRSSQARIRRISCISSDSLFSYSGYTTQSAEIPNALIMRQKTSMLGARFSFSIAAKCRVPQSALVKSLSPFGSLSESTPFCLLFSLHLYRTLSVHLRHYSTKRAPGEKCRISSGILELTVPNIPAFLPYKKRQEWWDQCHAQLSPPFCRKGGLMRFLYQEMLRSLSVMS